MISLACTLHCIVQPTDQQKWFAEGTLTRRLSCFREESSQRMLLEHHTT